MNYIYFVYFSKITLEIFELNPIAICIWFKDSLRKKQQPPVSSTPVAVSSPQQQTQNFSSPASVTHTAQPTVQSLQQPHIETIKDVSNISINDRNSRILFDLDWLTGPFFSIADACNLSSKQKLPEASASATSEIAGTSISDEQEDKDGDKDSKKKKNRCGICRKKVGLTGKLRRFGDVAIATLHLCEAY